MKNTIEVKLSENESLHQLELKANLDQRQRAHLEVLKDKMKKILGGRTKQQLAKAGDLVSLKNYRTILSQILDFLQTKKIGAEFWDWEEGERTIVDWQAMVDKYGQDNLHHPEFTPDGEGYVTVAQVNDKFTVLKNGKNLWAQDFPEIFSHQLSPDGGSVLIDFKGYNDKAKLAVNGKIWEQSYSRMEAAFSPDGKSVIACAHDSVIDHMEKQKDGSETPVYNSVNCVVLRNDEVILKSEDGKNMYQGASISPDNDQYACEIIDEEGNFSVIVNGKRWQQNFDECLPPVFSQDGKKVAVVYLDNKKGYSVAENDILIWPNHYEDCCCGPVYSPDGKKIAIGAQVVSGERYRIIENGTLGSNARFIKGINQLVYSPDSNNLAAICEIGPFLEVLVINDKVVFGPMLNITDITWSPDGKKIMLVYVKGNKGEDYKYIRKVIEVEEYLKA